MSDTQAKKPKKKLTLWRVIKIILLSLIAILVCTGGFGLAYMLGLDVYDKLDPQKILGVEQSTTIYDTNGDVISTVHGLENRTWVDISTLPDYVRLAFVAAEDTRFYSHAGVDVKRIFGALWQDIKAGGAVQGASTITQQLIKNSHLTPEKTLSRKIEEALMAIELERRYDKDDILEMYMNYIYFGAGAYGIEAAAQTYFSVEASQLTLEQAASLAGILKSPTNYAPHLNPENNKGRRDVVLDLMHEYGFVSEADVRAAKRQPLGLEMREKNNEFGWYIDAAMEAAATKLGISYDQLITGGYRVYTAMDPNIQRLCNDSYANADLFPEEAEDGSKSQSAMVVMNPSNGYVSAMVGGREYEVQRGLNRALALRRQPGSTIKPLMVYAPALKSGMYIAASILDDSPKAYENPHEVYEPNNFGNKYYGEVTLRTAVIKSLNVPAVEILNDIGLANGKRFAQSAGIVFASTDNGLSLALGGFSKGVSPLELCSGYNSFASGGTYYEPVIVTRVENSAGKTVYEHTKKSSRILSNEDAFILTDMLRDVVSVGTGRRLGGEIALAGKTGTNDYAGKGNRDAWMAAYNSEYTAVVWMGYDNTNDIHHLPSSCTGGTFPTLLLKSVFDGIYTGKPAPDFAQPASVRAAKLDLEALRQGLLQLAPDNAPEGSYIDEYLRADQVPLEPMPTPEPMYYDIYEFDVRLNQDSMPEVSFKATSALGAYAIYRINSNDQPQQVAYLNGNTSYVWIDSDVEMGNGYTYYAAPLSSDGTIGTHTEKVHILVIPVAVTPDVEEEGEASPESVEEQGTAEPTDSPDLNSPADDGYNDGTGTAQPTQRSNIPNPSALPQPVNTPIPTPRPTKRPPTPTPSKTPVATDDDLMPYRVINQ